MSIGAVRFASHHNNKPCCEKAGCGKGEAGKSMNPAELNKPAEVKKDEPVGVPIGIPIKQEEYDKLQKDAATPKQEAPKGLIKRITNFIRKFLPGKN